MRRILGLEARIITSPPTRDVNFNPEWLTGYELVVFYLHGEPGVRAWFGDRVDGGLRPVALREEALARCDLSTAGVFAASCYAGDGANRMRKALFDAGAKWVIAGAGLNYTSKRLLIGANALLLTFVCLLKRMDDVADALRWAKRTMHVVGLRLTREQREALADAQQFDLWRAYDEIVV
jgi:hypothetical protein